MPFILQVMMVPAYVAQKLNQLKEETDSPVVLYCFYGRQQGYINIRIRSPDTDIFFILLHYALELQGVTILFDTGTGNEEKVDRYHQISTAVPAGIVYNTFTRCDTTSAFKGIGKVKPIKTLQKSPPIPKCPCTNWRFLANFRGFVSADGGFYLLVVWR